MEKRRQEFLKEIWLRKHLIYALSGVILCLALWCGKSTAQFFPLPFGGPVFGGAPFGAIGPLGFGGGLGFAPGIGLPAPSLVGDPFALGAASGYAGLGFGWQQPVPIYGQPTFMQPSGMFGSAAFMPLTQPPVGSPYGAGVYGQSMPGYGAYLPTAPANYGQGGYMPPYGTGMPTTYAQPGYWPTSPTTPGNYFLDPRYAQSTTYGQSANPGGYFGGTSYPYTNPAQPTTPTTPTTPTQPSDSGGDTSIQDLPNLSALWQGSYVLYDPNSTSLEVLAEGTVNLGLTQKKNDYQVSGYMTVTNWEIVNEKKKGRVVATANYADSTKVDFLNVIVRFYPDLEDDETPTNDSVQYVWVFSGNIKNNTLEGSLNISGDNYSKAGTITLAKKQI
ncbi:MAG: hypothetical protein AB1611_06660 [bacterium]